MTYEDLSGDIVEDAVFERNKMVEERLGVKIECIQDGNAIDKVVIAVNGGSAEYDVMIDPCWRTAPKFVGNFFRNLRETKYLDFDKIWWNQSFNHEVLYKDAQYGITGAMVLSLYRRTFVTVFNKDIFTEANQPFLYEYVDNGTWTLDKQTEMVPLFHQDNGNNKQDQTGDIYGFISNDFIHVDPYWTSFEIDIIKKNPKVFFEMECDIVPFEGKVACQYGTTYASVMGLGKAEILENPSEKTEGMTKLMKTQTGKDFSFDERMVSIVSVIKITCTEFTAKKRPMPIGLR